MARFLLILAAALAVLLRSEAFVGSTGLAQRSQQHKARILSYFVDG